MKQDLPISQLLEEFILQAADKDSADLTCEVCGLTLVEFQEYGVLGCRHDYDVFQEPLAALLARAHQGTEHVGKVPRHVGRDQKRQNTILRLRAELRGAIAAEDYERAAGLRDRIKELEEA